MPRRCRLCAGLSVNDLVGLAEKEFVSRSFPSHAFYRHHQSFSDLEQSAEGGCNLCQLIVDCFKGAKHEYTWPSEWSGPEYDVESSMYTAAKRLAVSDVKISLEADQCFSGDTIEHVRVFDTLVVQVGPSEERSPDPEEDEEYHDALQPLPPLLLTLRVPRGDVAHVRGLQVGRIQVETHLGSHVYFDLATSWLQECRMSHPGCTPEKPPILPTRVIDVGVSTGPVKPRLVYARELRADYAALSHCWGGRITPVLTTHTLDAFQESLPYADLPPNFRDAITITRRLGLRYLWIDSLCILQDSRKDWEHESGHMAGVYGDATLTISAMAASSSSAGLLIPCPIREGLPKSTRLPVFGDDERYDVMVERADPEEESLDSLYHKGPLSSRGWTLQESLLSRRHLYYGARQIYWKCPGGLHSADGICARFKAPDKEYKNISNVLHTSSASTDRDRLPDRAALLQDYYELVQDYSRRKLTCESDKLPAFSGLAGRFQEYLEADYLAGLWSTDIERGLLWKAELGFCRHVTTYRSPSWSWAVTDDPIVFDHGEPFPPSSLQMKILEYEVFALDENKLCAEIGSGYLIVEGLTTVLLRSLQEENMLALNNAVGGADFDEPARDQTVDERGSSGSLYIFWTTHDDGDSYPLAVRNNLHGDKVGQLAAAQLSEEQYVLLMVYANDKSEGPVECLILRRVLDSADDNTFERVGKANFWDPPMGWLMSWKRCTLQLI